MCKVLTENQRQQLSYYLFTGLALGDGSLVRQGYFIPTKHLCVLVHIKIYGAGWCRLSNRSKAVLLLWILFVSCLCNTAMSVSCILDDTYWERADFLAFLYVVFSCVFVTFPYAVLSQVWYMLYRSRSLATFLLFLMKDCLNERAIP